MKAAASGAAQRGGTDRLGEKSAAMDQAGGFSFAVGGDPALLAGAGAAAPETAQERERRLQLRKLGYQIDMRYYRMSLAELREAAKRGDAQALTHLAERYLFQLDGHPREPDYEAGFPYREQARQALRQAFTQGNVHAAAMISESYLLDKQPQQAAAWNLVARRAGDELSADWFLKTKDYQAMSDAQKAAAARAAEQLWHALQSRKTP